MAAAIEDGEMQVLDIKIRNNVIKLMKLKSYLRFDTDRPLAEYIKM